MSETNTEVDTMKTEKKNKEKQDTSSTEDRAEKTQQSTPRRKVMMTKPTFYELEAFDEVIDHYFNRFLASDDPDVDEHEWIQYDLANELLQRLREEAEPHDKNEPYPEFSATRRRMLDDDDE